MRLIMWAMVLSLTLGAFSAPAQTKPTAREYLDHGVARLEKGELEGAISDFDKAIELDPRLADAYYDRGMARHNKDDLDGAIKDYDEAIRLDPLFSNAYMYRGIARGMKGNLEGAIADFNKTMELNPRSAEAYNNRGIARSKMGDKEGAIADFDKAIELDPRFAEAYSNRGDARMAKGDFKGSNKDYNTVIDLSHPYRTNKGKEIGDIDKAIANYKKAIELDPFYVRGHNNLAWLLATSPERRIRNGRKAVEYASKACRLTVWEDPDTLDTLAAAYAEAGNFSLAVEFEGRALDSPELAKDARDALEKRLQLYKQRKPYREK